MSARVVVVLGLALMTAGCEPIEEPWVREPGALASERARAAGTARALERRLYRGQTDR